MVPYTDRQLLLFVRVLILEKEGEESERKKTKTKNTVVPLICVFIG